MALLTPVTAPVDFKLQVHIVTSKGLRYMARIQSSTAGSRTTCRNNVGTVQLWHSSGS